MLALEGTVALFFGLYEHHTEWYEASAQARLRAVRVDDPCPPAPFCSDGEGQLVSEEKPVPAQYLGVILEGEHNSAEASYPTLVG